MRCGIDEAGLGPRVGSLFVVGVAVEGDISGVKESKEVFRRSVRTYARAESLVLSALRDLALYSPSVPDLWKRVFGRSHHMYDGMRLPMFGGKLLNLPFRIRYLVAFEIPAHALRSHRFLKDAHALVMAAERLPCGRVVSGLAGGVKHYERFLRGWRREERGGEIRYIRDGKEITFVRGADRKFREVALASLFAKYFREVHMMAVNRQVGLLGDIPKASGYPADPHTPVLVGRLLSRGLTWLVR